MDSQRKQIINFVSVYSKLPSELQYEVLKTLSIYEIHLLLNINHKLIESLRPQDILFIYKRDDNDVFYERNISRLYRCGIDWDTNKFTKDQLLIDIRKQLIIKSKQYEQLLFDVWHYINRIPSYRPVKQIDSEVNGIKILIEKDINKLIISIRMKIDKADKEEEKEREQFISQYENKRTNNGFIKHGGFQLDDRWYSFLRLNWKNIRDTDPNGEKQHGKSDNHYMNPRYMDYPLNQYGRRNTKVDNDGFCIDSDEE